MKNFQILIILLFSSLSVYADNLKGKKIICFLEDKDSNNKDQIELMGFEFTDEFYVNRYKATNYTPTNVVRMQYNTSAEIIEIYINASSSNSFYDIWRKDLKITRGKGNTPTGSIIWESKHCNLIDTPISQFISKKLLKYKQGNLL